MSGADYFVPDEKSALLSLQGLVTEFRTESGVVRGIDGVSYDVMPGECLGVVGESGSGKSVTVMSALGLLPPSARVASGHAYFDGSDLIGRSERELEKVRGRDIGMIFQDPMTALNPVLSVGTQIDETLKRHNPSMSKAARRDRVFELMNDVGIANAAERVKQYPHQFSGGMRQRVMIAIAIANRPKLIIADEPTTALDVTIQAQILDLLLTVQAEVGAALILITHDLAVIAEMADRVVVMYGGRVVENAGVDEIFHDTRHPYTQSLLSSLPRIDKSAERLLMVGDRPELAATGTLELPGRPAAEVVGSRLVRVGPQHFVAQDGEES
jgi:peptide/nickel transport system ATP-binding protein/oligopeptide transport system ATP-binding protein